ncbi:MAG TPA: hypothetical protein V6C97_25310 [Oculatellaceae cyanobacterium]
MAEDAHHKDPSSKWLVFFFVCFGMVVFAIGVFAAFTYNANAPEAAPEGGHHGMVMPQNVPHSQLAKIA